MRNNKFQHRFVAPTASVLIAPMPHLPSLTALNLRLCPVTFDISNRLARYVSPTGNLLPANHYCTLGAMVPAELGRHNVTLCIDCRVTFRFDVKVVLGHQLDGHQYNAVFSTGSATAILCSTDAQRPSASMIAFHHVLLSVEEVDERGRFVQHHGQHLGVSLLFAMASSTLPPITAPNQPLLGRGFSTTAQLTGVPILEWDNWFTAGNNPTGDFGVDPRTYTTNVSMQPATFGMTMDSARIVRECQAHCGCEIQMGQPQFRAVGTKLHFVAWTDPAAVMTSQIVCKEVIMLIASLRASWKAWCTKIPGSHPDHVRMSRLGTDLDQVRQTIRAFLFTQGPDPNSTQAFTTPALVFVALFHNTWMIVAIMDSNSRAPTHAEIVVDDTLRRRRVAFLFVGGCGGLLCL
ncbi:hypothetical protein HDU87_003564 [Geranomyces variabilis]|uniref:Uncharacterized protein n=1 Tax=Geranomyces variabilis TaxID=109894 RepID=A0AAD5XN20_9FUNG|nr:hypothetical protein HDU87_003564 [Geranomyces variabilis]